MPGVPGLSFCELLKLLESSKRVALFLYDFNWQECQNDDAPKHPLLLRLCFFATDEDECVLQSPCDENADCKNIDGSFECACRSGYTGDGITCDGESGEH